MIASICRKTAEKLGRKLQADQDQVSIYAYGLQIIAETFIKFTLIMLVAALCGIFSTTVIFLFTFSLFRWLSGGVHMSSFLRCLIFGLVLIPGMGFTATLPVSKTLLTSLYGIAAAANVYVIWRWVPAGTDKKQITDPQKRLKQKKESLLAFIIWNIMVLLSFQNHLYAYAFAAVLGSLFSSFFIMPAGYRLIDTLDQLTIWRGGEEGV